MSQRYNPAALTAYASALLRGTGLAAPKAQVLAEILVEGELLGRVTHGLALLAPYLNELATAAMALDGDPAVISERPAVACWDGGRLPGPWLTRLAFDEAAKRARIYGTGTVVIRRSHHIACLAAYLERVTSEGLIALVESSDPSVRGVAPHGGTRAAFTPNPRLAASASVKPAGPRSATSARAASMSASFSRP